MRLTHKLLAVVGVVALSACTPEQIAEWQAWHAADPAAAEAFANLPEVQAALAPAPRPEVQVDDDGQDHHHHSNDSSDSGDSGDSSRSVWDRVAECESNGNWSINTGNGYYGGLQFALQSWRAVGGTGYPHNASRAEQIRRAERLLDMQGWNAWPTCARRLGLL